VQFVVDRRPSKSFLTNADLPDISSESAATEPPRNKRRRLKEDGDRRISLEDANSAVDVASKTVYADDDDVDIEPDMEVVHGGGQRHSKRQHSDDLCQQNLEFAAAETKMSSPEKGTSDEGQKSVRKLHRDGKMKKQVNRERKEYVENVADESDRDGGTTERKKKHRSSSTDANSLRTHVKAPIENQSANSDILRNESPESVPRHRNKKSRRNQSKSFHDDLEGEDDQQCFSITGDYENVGSENTEKTTTATLSPSSDQKRCHKKRSRISTEKNVISSPSETIGEDQNVKCSEAREDHEKAKSMASDVASCSEVKKSPNKTTSECGKETGSLVESPNVQDTESGNLFKLVTQDDDNSNKDNTGFDDNTRFKVPSTPTREPSTKVATSPRSAGKPPRAVELSVDEDSLSQSCLDPDVISESPVGSPTKADQCSTDVDIVPTTTDGSSAGRVSSPAIVVLVRIVTHVSAELCSVCLNFV